jgi:hypothetical protein
VAAVEVSGAVGRSRSMPCNERPGGRRASLFAVLLLPFLLSSCFTLGLWGFYAETEQTWTGEEETAFAYDEETEWSWKLFFLRVLLTPVTVGLDCLTCPVQCVLFWDDDDDACKHR